MVRWVFIAGSLPVLLACSSPQDVAEQVPDQVGEASGESVTATLERRLAPGSARTEFRDEETRGEASRDFAYGWPAQADEIPAFAAMLTLTRDAALAAQKEEWEQSITEFGPGTPNAGCVSCINRSYSADWQIAADIPRFLILRANKWAYTGGAHGNSNFDALMWDRQANDGEGAALRPIALFASEAALQNAAYAEYCQALLEARGERLEMNIEGVSKFENCPGVEELVVVPTSTNGETLDRLDFLAAPYVAGSYAEGPYEFSIPMTAALMDVVRPKYRGAFAVKEQGQE